MIERNLKRFKNIIILIVNFKSSIQRELDRFFKALDQSDFNIREVTKRAFTQGKGQIKSLGFWTVKRSGGEQFL